MKTFVKFGSGNQLLGILAGDPATSSGPIVILPSAGLQPRSGPFRLYVELAQQLAPIGIRTFRFDVPGVGEAPRLGGYDENSATLAAIDALQERHGASEFVVGGICSAADVGWKAAVNDRRVVGILMLDGVSFTGPWYHYARNLDRVRRLPREGMRMLRDAMKHLGGKRAGDGMKSADFRDWPTHDEARQQFAALVARRVDQLWIYTGGFTDRFQHPRQFRWAFGEATRSPHVAMHFWPDCDHTFFARAHRDRLVVAVKEWMVGLRDQRRDEEVRSTGNAPCVASVPATATSLYAPPPFLGRPFRILLVLPERVPAWVSTFLEQAAATSWLEVWVLPVVGATLPKVTGLSLDMRAFLAFELARKGAVEPLNLVAVPSCDGIRIAPDASADSEGRRVLLRARKLQPDLVLSLGPPSWAEPLADVAPWGCWNIDASLIDPVSAGAALLAPMLQNASATPIELELQLERSWRAPSAVAESVGATRPGSFTQQREKAFLKLPMLLLRTMRRLANGDLDVPKHHSALLRLKSSPVPLRLGSGVRALASVLYRTALWQLTKRRKPLPWLLLLREDTEPLNPSAPEVRSTSVIQAPPGIDYWADPCVIEDLGRRLVFVEEMTPSRKGIITCLELHEGTVTRLGLAIEEPGHLSFPQLLRWNDEWYMTVESGALKRASLYRATGFPLEWSRVADLVTGRVFVDPILHFHEGHWYLFATVAENRNSTWDELFLFVSDELTGPFRPHPANPLVSDVRRARAAGRLFHHDGKLIRPAQDCASSYGSALVFNEVLELSPETYRERPISRLAPVWSDSLVACHTYSTAGGIELLDAKGIPAAGTPRLRVMDKPAKVRPASPAAPENSLSPAQAVMPMIGRELPG